MTVAATDLRLRPYAGPADVPDIVRIKNADNRADGVDERWTDEALRSWFGHPTATFDARRDVVVGELAGWCRPRPDAGGPRDPARHAGPASGHLAREPRVVPRPLGWR